MHHRKIEPGTKFGKLIVLPGSEWIPSGRNGTKRIRAVIARCECGTNKVVSPGNLRNGSTTSCGCSQRKHMMFGTPEYAAWVSMLQRCTNPKARNYRNYGARGISVCPQWADFPSFLRDMGMRPSPKHSLDRWPNNDGNYEIGNCRWATRIEQGRNKRNNHLLTVNGETATLAEWTQRTGLGKTTIRERVRRGWSDSRAVTAPPMQ